jgi:hypothetical protein
LLSPDVRTVRLHLLRSPHEDISGDQDELEAEEKEADEEAEGDRGDEDSWDDAWEALEIRLERSSPDEGFGLTIQLDLQGFVIVSKDGDFADLSVLYGAPPKIVWIRRGNCSTAAIVTLLRTHASGLDLMMGRTVDRLGRGRTGR